ncbi:MAG: hypothetical protein FWD17_07825, partial [Polyangiaceae bacterium]|nr:hypothetical protein [Polyangiaceae bacterium]
VHTPHDVPHAERLAYQTIRRHRLGTPQAADETVFPSTGDATKALECTLDAKGVWLVVTVHHGWSGNDVFFRRAEGEATFRQLDTRAGAMVRALPLAGQLFVLTDDGAPNGRIVRVDPANPARDRWQDVVPERPDSPLKRAAVIGDRLLLTYSVDALASFEVRDVEGHSQSIPPPGLGASFISGRPGDDTAFLHFSSPVSPPAIWRISMRSGERSLLFRSRVPFDPDRFTIERFFATSKDGTAVPVFVVKAREVPTDGSAPALIYGYGGFRVSLAPAFTEGDVPWVEAGGVYALVCLRGGLEYGEPWHRAGCCTRSKTSSMISSRRPRPSSPAGTRDPSGSPSKERRTAGCS